MRIAKNRSNYKIIGDLASIFYFSLITLKNFNPMYEFSLANYIQVFKKAMKNAEKPQPKDKEVRIKNILK